MARPKRFRTPDPQIRSLELYRYGAASTDWKRKFGWHRACSPGSASRGDFHAQSASEFSGLQRNSLRNGTRNFWSVNREFFGENREFSLPNRDLQKIAIAGRPTHPLILSQTPACTRVCGLLAAHNRLVAGSSPAGPTTQSRGRGDFLDRRQMPAIGGLSFRRSVSATARRPPSKAADDLACSKPPPRRCARTRQRPNPRRLGGLAQVLHAFVGGLVGGLAQVLHVFAGSLGSISTDRACSQLVRFTSDRVQ